MIDTLAFDTARYSDLQEPGWVSRYSYAPEWMIGINSTFFSFKNGNIYQHDSDNVNTATFYGIKYPATLTTEFNDAPLDKKLFKTIHIDSTDTWTADLLSDLGSGQIDAQSFEQKEGDWFSYIRQIDSTDIEGENLKMLSTQGVGVVDSYAGLTTTFTTPIDSTAFAVGDRVFVLTGLNTIDYIGNIVSYTEDTITLSGALITPGPGDFIAVGKNRIAESVGIRGYYLSVTLTNSNDDGAEIFAVSSSVFKSYP